MQAAIDRNLGSAAEGQLFETDAQHLDESCGVLTLYIRSSRYMDQVIACLKALAWMGFGKKSSTGLGGFEMIGLPELCGIDPDARARFSFPNERDISASLVRLDGPCATTGNAESSPLWPVLLGSVVMALRAT